MLKTPLNRIHEYLDNKLWLPIGTCALMAMTRAINEPITMVHANSPLLEQAERALLSALWTGNPVIDAGTAIIKTATTIGIAQITSSPIMLGETGVGCIASS